MRKRDIKYELSTYPCFIHKKGQLIQIQKPDRWDYPNQLHHFIPTQWEQNNPEKYIMVAHLQKLIIMHKNMHDDAHARISNFKEKYGIELDEVLFNWKNFIEREVSMISAQNARNKSDSNHIKLRIAAVEKAIKNAIEKGKYEIYLLGELEDEVIDELKKAGFTYEQQVNGWKVRW